MIGEIERSRESSRVVGMNMSIVDGRDRERLHDNSAVIVAETVDS